MSSSAMPGLRCPHCSAHVPEGAQWCTLCYVSLLPEPVTEPEPDPEPDPAPAVTAAGKHAKPDAVAGNQPERERPGPDADVEALAAQLLAQLAAAESGSPVGAWSGLVDSPVKKVAIMTAGSLLGAALLLGLLALVGALL